jgi:hypothetical protein
MRVRRIIADFDLVGRSFGELGLGWQSEWMGDDLIDSQQR